MSYLNVSEKNHQKSVSSNYLNTKFVVYSGVMLAITTILYVFLEFPLPFFPSYLMMDFSDVIAIISGITLGPVAAILIEILKNVMRFLIKGSYSGGIGELMNAIVGIAMILPTILIYRKKRTVKRLIIGLLIGVVSMVLMAAVTNYYIALPAYIEGGTSAEYIDMIIYGLTPFNLFKSAVVSIIGFGLITSMKGVLNRIELNKSV